MEKYFGGFTNRRDVAINFLTPDWDKPKDWQVPEDFPSEDAILFASYGGRSYEGDALVIFQANNKLYEVNGYHCSCYGLADQWKPEETLWPALNMRDVRLLENEHESEAIIAFKTLLATNLPNETTDAKL